MRVDCNKEWRMGEREYIRKCTCMFNMTWEMYHWAFGGSFVSWLTAISCKNVLFFSTLKHIERERADANYCYAVQRFFGRFFSIQFPWLLLLLLLLFLVSVFISCHNTIITATNHLSGCELVRNVFILIGHHNIYVWP